MENRSFSDSPKKDGRAVSAGVSPAVIRRLPRYHRYLKKLLSAGVMRISSGELAKLMNITASQIRQDLNCFGGFGQQGYGYNVKYLDSKITEILGLENDRCAVLIGAGNFGRTIAGSNVFGKSGVRLAAMFDKDESIVGQKIADIPVYPMSELSRFCTENRVDIAILTVPQSAAQKAATTLCELGVRGIWNLTDEELYLPGVTVENVQLSDSLMMLMYRIGGENKKDKK